MYELLIFLIGIFVGRYLLQWLDFVTDFLANKQTLSANKIQAQINEILGSQEPIQTHAIGFQYIPENTTDIEDEEEW